jgi:peptidoglycan/xylan/chitin deacetylase (PgdA/CDA1 family)
MIATIERRLRRRWHHARRRMGAGASTPNRLIVSKATWLDDARSPVTLMIDDLTNAFHGTGSGTGWDQGGDWGGGLDKPGSALRFLEERLLNDYPEARVTFFTVAGPISAYTHDQPFRHSAPLDADSDSRRFFARLAADPRFELAYHGYNHGTAGERTDRFVQEWQGFPSRAAAAEQTRKGLDIFHRAIGTVPRGGKYGGWDYNQYADDAVDECGFLWWCRDWMPRDILDRVADDYYEPQFFGRNLVVAIPSTVHGHFWDPRQVEILLARRQIIGIEEHIAPIRPDGLVQTPNIVDDVEELRRLYAYLRSQHVWHATGTEIASYVNARERSLIYDVTREGFSIRYEGRVERPPLTLCIDCAAVCSAEKPVVDIAAPDGTVLNTGTFRFDRRLYRHRVTIPVTSGRYQVQPRAL